MLNDSMCTSMNAADKQTLEKRVDEMLLAMLGSKQLVDRWWNSPNWHFKLEKPYIIWDTDPMAVWKYVADHTQK